MADWKTTIRLGDLHQAHEAGELRISQVAKKLAERLRQSRYKKDLSAQIRDLDRVRTVEQYDDVLERLYAFGNLDHRIWFDPTRTPSAKS